MSVHKAYGYVRVSSAELKAGYPTIEEQKEKIESYAKSIGLKVSQMFVDQPIEQSGEIDTSLGGIYGLLDECRRKKVYFIITNDLSRLHREETDVHFYAEIIRINKCVFTVGQKADVLKDRDIMEYISESFENETKRKRQSGPVPFGYKKVFTEGEKSCIIPDEKESEIVKMIFEEYKSRKSYASVKRFLESKKIKTRGGNNWSRAGLAWLLKNEIYLGYLDDSELEKDSEEYDESQENDTVNFEKIKHEGIIDEKLFKEVQVVIKQRQRKRKRKKIEK